MHERFDEMFNLVSDVFVLLQREHAVTRAMLVRIEDQLRDQFAMLSGISDQVVGVRGVLADMKRLIIRKVNENSRIGCMRDPEFPPPQLSAEEFLNCVQAFGNEFADLPMMQLGSDDEALMGRQLAYANNLALGELRRLARARDVGQLPADVVGVPALLGSVVALRDFLSQQPRACGDLCGRGGPFGARRRCTGIR